MLPTPVKARAFDGTNGIVLVEPPDAVDAAVVEADGVAGVGGVPVSARVTTVPSVFEDWPTAMQNLGDGQATEVNAGLPVDEPEVVAALQPAPSHDSTAPPPTSTHDVEASHETPPNAGTSGVTRMDHWVPSHV